MSSLKNLQVQKSDYTAKTQSVANRPKPQAYSGTQGRNSAQLEQRIRERAYELYVAGGCRDGHADEDWRLAEEEILGITGGG